MLGRAKRTLKNVFGTDAAEAQSRREPSEPADTAQRPEPKAKPKRHTKSTADYLRSLAESIPLQFDNLIDIGVNVGTPELYNAYPDKSLVLIEPSTVRRSQIEEIVSRRGAIWIAKGAGSEKSTLTLIEDLENPAVSSFSQKTKHAGSSGVIEPRDVQVDTLDNMLREHDVHGRHFLKIDTEGHELEVLLGATESLRNCAAVMMEVSVTERYVDGYLFSDIIATMRDNGFELYDILFVAPEIRTENRTKFIDALFVPSNRH